MNLTLYDYVYLIIGIFDLCILRKFMECFFDMEGANRLLEKVAYSLYFIVSIPAYFYINKPYIFVIINLIGMFSITCSYQGNLRKRILATLSIYIILLGIECAVGSCFIKLNPYLFVENTFVSIYGLISVKLISYLVAFTLKNFRNIKKSEQIALPVSYWVSSILVPLSSLYLIVLILNADGIKTRYIFLSIIFLVALNYSIFSLYDNTVAKFEEKMERAVLTEQNKYYDKQLQIMQTSLESTRLLKHDLKNHLISIEALLKSNESLSATEYIEEIKSITVNENVYAVSGNLIVDSIVNFKMDEAKKKGVQGSLTLNIPEKLNVSTFDITCILGNLLDNAVTAAANVKGGMIDLRIKYDAGKLIIKISNSFDGKLVLSGKELLTSKQDKQNHGIGLESVKKAISNYDGEIDMEYTQHCFLVTILLYLK